MGGGEAGGGFSGRGGGRFMPSSSDKTRDHPWPGLGERGGVRSWEGQRADEG